jgi:hypothetical protein
MDGLDKEARLAEEERKRELRAAKEEAPAERLNPRWPWRVQGFDAGFFGVIALEDEVG